ncbi:hypothetical protein TSUD_278930 [Trifolium subterraneum]|uniref:Integrase catalytic domain-containing protein n=1 Tax=Trifolium subterraneum TaxID=3900 RepID=A0A2Z6MZA6_TRISU|nr:hypothetical protein TSUD_278930 [Trifolium subterraneum]
MADSDFAKPAIPKFDGFYEHWAMLMENLLRSKEYWSLIETGVVTAPANATFEQQASANASKLLDLKVKNYLFQSIDRSILETILERDTAKEIWDAMRTKYQGSTRVKRAQLQALRREFEVLAMGEGETIDEYFARTMSIANKVTSFGERMTQVTIVEKILRSLPAKFNFVVCSIEQSNDVTTLSIDELQSSLIVQEQRMKSQQRGIEEQALKAVNGGRGSGSGRGRGRSFSRARGRGRVSKENVECFKCHKLAHYKNECPDWEENANYAEFFEEEETLLMARTNTEELRNETWFLDSGCSNHMVGNKDWLYEFDGSYRDSVKLGDDSKMNVMGKGNIKFSIAGKIHVITNVFYIPGLKSNLLSIGQIQQKHVTIVFKNDLCKIYHDDKGLLFTTHMSPNRMYVVNATVIVPNCLQVTKKDWSQLWHQRYGHLSIKGLNTLAKKDMVNGLPVLDDLDKHCGDCLTGKQHMDAMPKRAVWRAKLKLELVHSDLCGPLNPTSNGGNRYFITFTDDFSRKTWTYILKEKSSALDTFKMFKLVVEKESGCAIQTLRTDRGGEFLSTDFHEFCSNQGIKRQLTAAYTPQQNGVSERKNRTILNMVRKLTEDIYVEQPLGYQNGNKNMVYKLRKALYGLKQAPRAWYSKIESYFATEKFKKCSHEPTLFVKYGFNNKILIVSLYVDDLICTGNNLDMILDFKESMKKNFAMTDLGKMKYFLGVEVIQSDVGIFIHQHKYAIEILKRFGMENCNNVCSPIVPGCKLDKDENGKATDATTFKQMVGCLMYLLATRPDLAYSICLVARFMDRPTDIHVAAVKRIMRYLKGTLTDGIMYKHTSNKNIELVGWSDSDYAGDVNDRKSTSGYVFMLGTGAIAWSSKKQPIVTLSTTEAEYVAAAVCACQSIWLKAVLSHMKRPQNQAIVIHCDNSSSIKLSKNPVMHGRCKHIDVRFHFLRNLTKDGMVEMKHCKSQDQLVDIMTKPLKLESFLKLKEGLGMRSAQGHDVCVKQSCALHCIPDLSS